ncbi:manganese catalase family protein [Cyanobacteria bacterium FACHB-63]|nr:manganese catalase family protein [Cyanobacteria bacterium FACHB-63]
MFLHTKRLQYFTPPSKPDPIYAKKLQELIGGSMGEMTVMMQYLFQGWNCRGPAKYRDLLLDTGTEEIGHVEMLATMVAYLLDKAPVEMQEEGVKDPVVGAVMGGTNPRDVIAAAMNPQHEIVSGQGAMPADSVGFPWNGRFITASGNLLADFRSNLHAESQGLMQTVRLYEMTDDPGIRDHLSFMIARDTMHQNQWLAAIEELRSDGFEDVVTPKIAHEYGKREYAYQFWNNSEGEDSAEGRWAKGQSMDGKGQFEYVANPQPIGPIPEPPQPKPKLHATPATTAMQKTSDNPVKNAIEGVKDAIDGFTK